MTVASRRGHGIFSEFRSSSYRSPSFRIEMRGAPSLCMLPPPNIATMCPAVITTWRILVSKAIQNLRRQAELERQCLEALARHSRRQSSRRALYAGAGTTAVTGTTLTAITATLGAPTANLGGYATAQIVASSLFGTGGPWLASAIATAGGPVTVTVLVSIGLGGAAWGGVKLFGRMFRRKRRW